LGFKKIQNGSHCHGNQGTKWPPNTKMWNDMENMEEK
jgi:hypothetical protein